MNLVGKRALITGASSGIGAALTTQLLEAGAHVLLAGRNVNALRQAVTEANLGFDRAEFLAVDITRGSDRHRLCQAAREWQGGVDILINNAGVSDFGLLEDAEPEAIERAIATNLTAPVDLCRRLLPHLRAREQAQIVNIGSVFGNIGFAGNSVYCATKFGLRGFSEALRRELAGTNVQVRYYAPRATRTSINSSAANAVNDELRIAVDDPQDVAEQVMQLMQSGRFEAVLGWPERLFARVNALVPRIVDRALAAQLPVIVRHARRGSGSRPVVQGMHIEKSRRVG